MVQSSQAPVWFDPLAPLGSAVKYVASLSPRYHWVGIYVLKGKSLVLGPFIGSETEHQKIPVGTGVCGTAVAENRDMNVPDVTAVDNYLACNVETRSELVVLIRDSKGKVLGQIDIDSHLAGAFGADEEAQVKQVAQELGELWPA
jgi:GAF domain-containing protein